MKIAFILPVLYFNLGHMLQANCGRDVVLLASIPAQSTNQVEATGYRALKVNVDTLPDPIAKIEEDMVHIGGGTFTMGCEEGRDQNCEDKEKPPHKVHVRDFYMCRYEVTQAQWRVVMGTSPSFNKGCDECPVENINWLKIQEFLKKLNALTGKQYRLPTEAEWEFAERGGNESRGYLYSGGNELDEISWYKSDDTTHPVGQKKPNELGLYDMTGNACEFVQDCWHHNYNGAPTDGTAWLEGNNGDCTMRIFRDAGPGGLDQWRRTSSRMWTYDWCRGIYEGFRLARDF